MNLAELDAMIAAQAQPVMHLRVSPYMVAVLRRLESWHKRPHKRHPQRAIRQMMQSIPRPVAPATPSLTALILQGQPQ